MSGFLLVAEEDLRDVLTRAQAGATGAVLWQEVSAIMAGAKPGVPAALLEEAVAEVRSYSVCRCRTGTDVCRRCRVLASSP